MANEQDWTLRYYRDGDEEGILELLTAAFGRWPGVDIAVAPIDYLRWKLNSHPIAPQFHYVAVADERIIGCQLIVVQRLKCGDRELLADTCTDYAVHPDYQGRGLSREIWEFDPKRFAATFDLLINITDSRAVKHQIKTIGHSRTLANELEWLELPVAAPRADAAPPSHVTLRTAAEFDERTDEFCRDALRPFDLAIVRDRTYLNWRFGDPRAGRYTIRLAEDGGRLLGYAVFATSRGKGFIADLLVLPGRSDVIEALAVDAARYFAGSGLPSVRCWSVVRHPYRETLLRCGFAPLRPVERFGIGRAGREVPLRDDPNAAVHFTVGDTDIV